MGILGTLFFMILFALLFIVVLGINILVRLVGGIRNLWNIITGNPRSRQNGGFSAGYSNTRESTEYESTSTNQQNRPHSKGVFADDEGTYVDFEEVKE